MCIRDRLKMYNTRFKETGKYIKELQITQEDIEECLPLKTKLKKTQGFQENHKKRIGAIWTDERRERDRSRMKDMWERRMREEKPVEPNINHIGSYAKIKKLSK